MRGKKRTNTHIIGETGIKILIEYFPKEWVPREYTPDYGLDLSLELFSAPEEGCITKGEHVFFQVKTTEKIEFEKLSVHPRFNVEKEYREIDGSPIEIEVIKFVIDTDLLYTVETMGSAVPVLLALVELTTKNAYFVCLNDYIEKVLCPTDSNYYEKDHKTIYIPASNKINSNTGITAIEWYGKRAKLYALFNKIHYQATELQYCPNFELESRVKHFLGS